MRLFYFQKLYVFLFFISLSGFLQSCENEVDVTAPYKEISIVYGLLNPGDSIQYIKINKAFLNETGDAYQFAQISDSLYHPEAMSVQLVKMVSNSPVQTITLDTAMVPKEPGTFGGPNQLLYRTPPGTVIDPSSRYELRLIKKKNNEVFVSSSTEIVHDFQLTAPLFDFVWVNKDGYHSENLEWKAAKYGRLYELVIRMYYTEVSKSTNESVQKYVDWLISDRLKAATLNGNEKMYAGLEGKEFYANIQTMLDPDAAVDRYADPKLEIRFTVAADDLSTYIEVNRPSENLNDVPPEYTNISNGLGIFSSRIQKNFRKNMNLFSVDELKSGPITGDLGFR